MTDEKKPKGLAERQRLFRERQREAGFTQRTLWIHAEAEEEGRRAAANGEPCEPMAAKHPLSWAVGWINETESMGPELVKGIRRNSQP
ncbi:hypothetical protein PUP66_23155 [Pseudomonas chlororaphis]|nr:hypothetical protein [Pseudomonas chlororaphis]WDH45962.1 hypothetical protein PUP66_23155 [Pseudomonas chlororaphis]WDH57809.1 hypothetical protein PUP56_23160 [Pseudomonas chlororaphis]WQE17066.1 hypothetical protein U0007_21975 [Pseudomonas chlororaphis]